VVGLAEGPFVCEGAGEGGVCWVTCRAVAGDPGDEVGFVLGTEGAVVGPGGGVSGGGGGGEPGGHCAAVDLLADHGGVFDGVGEGFEGEGAEAVFAMAFDAVGLEDAGDLVVVGDGGGGDVGGGG
jgi:hypothetical protein